MHSSRRQAFRISTAQRPTGDGAGNGIQGTSFPATTHEERAPMSLWSRIFYLRVDETSQCLRLYYDQSPMLVLARLLVTLFIPAIAAGLQLQDGIPLGLDWGTGLAIYVLFFWTMNRYVLVVDTEGTELTVSMRPFAFDLIGPSAHQFRGASSLKSYGAFTFVKVERSDGEDEWVFVPPAFSPTCDHQWAHEKLCDFLNSQRDHSP